jgi:hypothetical protein
MKIEQLLFLSEKVFYLQLGLIEGIDIEKKYLKE